MLAHRLSQLAERIRTFAASADGSMLDDATWTSRHTRISWVGWGLLTVSIALAPLYSGIDRLIYPAMMFAAMAVASMGGMGRRVREIAVGVDFLMAQLFVNRYLGNLLLGPVEIIILTFYQDWVPIVAGVLFAIGLVVWVAIDPSLAAGTKGFEAQPLVSGTAFRAGAVIAAAWVTVFVWRAGTQLARDPLTGLLSRAGAERLIDRQLRRGRRVAVWACDVDGFRTVNQELGPGVGDQVLRHVASGIRTLGSSLPGAWSCGRLGADTFLIAAWGDLENESLESFAHRIEREVGVPYRLHTGYDVPIRISVGATVGAPGDTGSALIRAAEQNMRGAKGLGMTRVVVGAQPEGGPQSSPALLTAEVYRACERDELEFYLQPIVRLDDGTPAGAETLVRWHHPDRGLVLPGAFLPEVESDSALMAVLAEVLGAKFVALVTDLLDRHGREWLPYGYAYNLAPIRLRDPLVVLRTEEIMKQFGIENADWLCTFEVTEGALIDIDGGDREVLSQFRDLGFKIALDDFGTGYSSLAQLPNLPLDSVKIDKTFVRSLGRSATDTAVVRAVSEIASAAGLTVVAEGVEEEDQRDVLVSINPEMLAQGWLYAPAMPLGEFEVWMAGSKLARVE